MAKQNCKKRIVALHGLSDEEAEAIISELKKIKGKIPSAGDISFEMKKAGSRAARKAEIEARNEELAGIKQAQAIQREAGRVFTGAPGKKEANFNAAAGGARSRAAKLRNGGEHFSWDASSKMEMVRQAGRLINRLTNDIARWPKLAKDKKFQREVIEEMYRLPETKGEKSFTGNEVALKFARIINEEKEMQRAVLLDNGVTVGKLEGHVVYQAHDAATIRNVSFEKWRSSILPLLDKEATFLGQDADEFLKDAFSEITFSAVGKVNIGKRLSASRALKFKDANSWLKYDDVYGSRGNVMGSIFEQFINRAYNIGLVKRLGPNPEKAYAKLKEIGAQAAKDAGEDRFDSRAADRMFDALLRKDVVPTSKMVAAVTDFLAGIQDLSKLGGSAITSIVDLASVMSTMQRNGIGYFNSAGAILKDLRRFSRTPAERKMLASMGIEIEATLALAVDRFSGLDIPMGSMAKVRQKFFELNLLGWWTRMRQGGFAISSAHHLGGLVKAETRFTDLNPKLQRSLKQYSIGGKEWGKFLRSPMIQDGKRSFLVPDKSMGVELEDRLATFFSNEATYAVPMPGIRERAMIYQGIDRGTIPGAGRRLLMQFKMHPITVATKVIPRVAEDGFGPVGLMMLQMTLLGYTAGAIKDILRGREPRALLRDDGNVETATLMDALARGGALGIYGDIITQDWAAYGKEQAISSLAGPTFKTAFEALGVTASAGKDLLENGNHADWGRHGADATRLFMSNVPFANLFYVKPAVDYLVTHNLQEMMNPGYLKRMERRLRREGREFFVPPTGL